MFLDILATVNDEHNWLYHADCLQAGKGRGYREGGNKKYGYSQKTVADYVGLHFTRINHIVQKARNDVWIKALVSI